MKMLPDHAYGLARLAAGKPPAQSPRINATLRRWGCYTTKRIGPRTWALQITEKGKRLLSEYEAKHGSEDRYGPRTFAPAIINLEGTEPDVAVIQSEDVTYVHNPNDTLRISHDGSQYVITSWHEGAWSKIVGQEPTHNQAIETAKTLLRRSKPHGHD